MRNQTVRLFLYSSLAILVLTLAWGIKQIPKQRELAEKELKSSLEQELITMSAAVRASTSALRFKLLDVLKAEGNDKPTRAFQDSPFVAATLLEWDQTAWRPMWHSSKSREEFLQSDIKASLKDWPLAKLNGGESFFAKVADSQGQAHFALIVPVRKPSGVPMVGIGIFPANQFGLLFSADRAREVRVFDDKGFALALSRPVYLGSSLKREPLVEQMLDGDEVTARQEWKNEAGVELAGAATRMSDSNLFVSVEAPLDFGRAWFWRAWLYLVMCAAAAVGLNWYLLNSLIQPLLQQISQSDAAIEKLKRSVNEAASAPAAPAGLVKKPEMQEMSFIEPTEEVLPPSEVLPATRVPLAKVVQGALRSLDSRLKENRILVQQTGLGEIEIASEALQLQTAIEEIIKNAIEAMGDSDERWLSFIAEERNGRVLLSIEDTGAGVPAENLEKVFDPFFSTKDAQGVSRGLGLNVVRRVLEEMEGKVQVKNRAEGTGTAVELEWPSHVDVQATLKIPAIQQAAAEAAVHRALFDDDEDLDQEIMQAPLVPTRKPLPSVPVRKPVVRTLD